MTYSLFIGRFQPFHDGHEAIVRKILDEGGHVCIAIRSTYRDKNNPHSIEARCAMIQKRFKNEIASRDVAVIIIPDIKEVVFGRDVGWGIREVRLDKKTEAISATKIRRGNDRK